MVVLQKTTPPYGVIPNQLPGIGFDSGELAARLGSMSKFRRTGQVIYTKDFSVEHSGFTVSSNTFHTSLVSGSGIGSIQLNPNVGVDATLQQTPIPYIANQKYGLEFTFYRDGNPSAYTSLGVQIFISGGASNAAYYFVFDYANNRIWVNNNFFQQIIKTSYFQTNAETLNVKMVVDPTTGYYVSWLINEETFDLSSYKGITAPTGGRQIYAIITGSVPVYGASFFISDYIFTIGEN